MPSARALSIDTGSADPGAPSTYAAVLPADHVNVGITDPKLGRALLRQQRAAAAEPVLQQAQQILGAQPGPESTWLKAVREDLATVQQRAADGRERPH